MNNNIFIIMLGNHLIDLREVRAAQETDSEFLVSFRNGDQIRIPFRNESEKRQLAQALRQTEAGNSPG